jgi:pilus assembly protein CpaB
VKTRILTIALAAILGLLGVVAVLAYVHQANERAVNGLKAKTVLWAKGAIPADTSLYKAQQEDLLGTEKVPASSLSNSPLSAPVQSVTAVNRHQVVSANVPQGMVLLQNMLASASTVKSESGSSVVPPRGKISVSVHMCVSEAVANYITVGSWVAIFDTLVVHSSGIVRTCETQHNILSSVDMRQQMLASTQLVVPRAQVLAVGVNPAAPSTPGGSSSATVTNDPSSSSPASSSTDEEVLITLAVDQADAERVMLIDEVGLPYMALLGSTTPILGGPVGLLGSPQQP